MKKGRDLMPTDDPRSESTCDPDTCSRVSEYLAAFLSPERQQRIEQVLDSRTRYLCLVLEDVYKPQNAAATLRTCDGLGLQDVHIIEGDSPFSLDGDVDLGSARWMTLHRYHQRTGGDTTVCFQHLRAQGYCIVATTPDAGCPPLWSLGLERPVAIVFGNEEKGLSDTALRDADCRAHLPVYGFTQSYNISVSVAMVFSFLTRKLRASNRPWHLSEKEKTRLRLEWYRTSVRRSDLLEREFLSRQEQ